MRLIKIIEMNRKHIVFSNGSVLVKPDRGDYIRKLIKSPSTYFIERSDDLKVKAKEKYAI